MSAHAAMPDASAAPPTTRPGRPIGVRPLSAWERGWCALWAIGCLMMLGIGAWLTPSPTGMGTHMQLGVPPCGWLWSTGTPCATCGMTTAVTQAAHGNVMGSIRAQPFGFLVALGAAVSFWIALHGACTGSRVDRVLWWFLRPRVLTVGGIVFFASWGYKVWMERDTLVPPRPRLQIAPPLTGDSGDPPATVQPPRHP